MNRYLIELELRTGDIVLSRTPFSWLNPISYLSFLIRKFGQADYNHAALVVSNWNKPFINEVIGIGITSHSFGTRLKGKDIRIIRPNNPPTEKEIANRANEKIGITKYDFIGLIYQAIYLTTGKWLGKNYEKAGERMYCFEYVAWVYDTIFPHWWKVTPSEVINSKEFRIVLEAKIN